MPMASARPIQRASASARNTRRPDPDGGARRQPGSAAAAGGFVFSKSGRRPSRGSQGQNEPATPPRPWARAGWSMVTASSRGGSGFLVVLPSHRRFASTCHRPPERRLPFATSQPSETRRAKDAIATKTGPFTLHRTWDADVAVGHRTLYVLRIKICDGKRAGRTATAACCHYLTWGERRGMEKPHADRDASVTCTRQAKLAMVYKLGVHMI